MLFPLAYALDLLDSPFISIKNGPLILFWTLISLNFDCTIREGMHYGHNGEEV